MGESGAHRRSPESEIETTSTSRNTAVATPLILRERDHVRLVFVPMLVNNERSPEAAVRGCFIYQKKATKDQWAPVATVPLNSLKCGEGYKLDLKAGEVLKLAKGLWELYRLFRQQGGVPQGRSRWVRIESGLARLVALNEAEFRDFLDTHQHDAAATLARLLRWMAASPQRAEAAARLAGTQQNELPQLTALLGLSAVKDALEYWRTNQDNDTEGFWQRALAERAYVLSQVFAYPVVVIGQKAYLGGKDLTNAGGKVVDYLATVESTDAVVLIEIKTPKTPLLGSEYRDKTYPLSSQLVGAVAQSLVYRQSLMREFNAVRGERRLTLGEPRCLVVAGNAQRDLATREKRESFELQRERLQGVTVVTYDELFTRLQRLVDLLEGGGVAARS